MTAAATRFSLAAVLGLLLVWGGSVLSLTPPAALAGTVQAGENAANDTVTDCATLTAPDDLAGSQQGHGNDHDHSAGRPHAGCCMTACFVLAFEPGRFPATAVVWALARVALGVDDPQGGRLISPPQRPPRARV